RRADAADHQLVDLQTADAGALDRHHADGEKSDRQRAHRDRAQRHRPHRHGPRGSAIFRKKAHGVLRCYLPTITSEALMIAVAVSPTFSPRSSTASLVIEDVRITPLPISIRTWAVVWPFCTSLTVPRIWLRALSFICLSIGSW